MQTGAKIDVTGALKALEQLETGVQQGQEAAMAVTVTRVGRQMAHALANDNDLPVSVASKRVKTDIQNGIGKVWVGTKYIQAAQLQPLRNVGTGVMAGNLFVDGGFVISKIKGKQVRPFIAKRTTKNRYPIIYPIIVAVKTLKQPTVDSRTAQDTYVTELEKHL